jgi:hypothetical protein
VGCDGTFHALSVVSPSVGAVFMVGKFFFILKKLINFFYCFNILILKINF